MSVQTPAKVSTLSKILMYFELVASLGMEVPEQHVTAISTLIETLVGEIQGGVSAIQQAHQTLATASATIAPPTTTTTTPVVVPGTSVSGSQQPPISAIPQPAVQLGSTVSNPIIPNVKSPATS